MAEARRRIPELDGFRVVMVGIVAWYHFWQQSWLTPYIFSYSLDYLLRAGYMAVDGTILLSAFLLFLPYVRSALEEAEVPDTRNFFRRRVMRIMPSYLFTTFLMLFAVALPYGLYADAGTLVYDVVMHVFCISNWDVRTYLGTQLGGSSWTIAVEMQLYLLVPFLGRMLKKNPMAVFFALCAISAYFRGYCVYTMHEYGMVVNQPLSFLDVYALGMACAFGYVRLERAMKTMSGRQKKVLALASTVFFVLSVWLLLQVIRSQARSGDMAAIQSGQMIRRPALAAAMSGMLLSLPFCLRPVRWVFGNPVMHFLSGISMNFYLLHQNIAVQLRRWQIPFSEYAYPNQQGDRPWQFRYMLLVTFSSLLAAILVTYAVEKPAAAGLRRLFAAMDRRRDEKRRRAGKKETKTE